MKLSDEQKVRLKEILDLKDKLNHETNQKQLEINSSLTELFGRKKGDSVSYDEIIRAML